MPNGHILDWQLPERGFHISNQAWADGLRRERSNVEPPNPDLAPNLESLRRRPIGVEMVENDTTGDYLGGGLWIRFDPRDGLYYSALREDVIRAQRQNPRERGETWARYSRRALDGVFAEPIDEVNCTVVNIGSVPIMDCRVFLHFSGFRPPESGIVLRQTLRLDVGEQVNVSFPCQLLDMRTIQSLRALSFLAYHPIYQPVSNLWHRRLNRNMRRSYLIHQRGA